VDGAAVRAGLPHTNANQYTFIVTIKPANKAGQLNSGTALGASTNNNTDNTHFTLCQTMKPSAAAMALTDAVREVNPLANSAEGMTTVNAPYSQDSPSDRLSNQTATTEANDTATINCVISTRQTDSCGWLCRQTRTCSALQGCNSASCSVSSSCEFGCSLLPEDDSVLVIRDGPFMQQSL